MHKIVFVQKGEENSETHKDALTTALGKLHHRAGAYEASQDSGGTEEVFFPATFTKSTNRQCVALEAALASECRGLSACSMLVALLLLRASSCCQFSAALLPAPLGMMEPGCWGLWVPIPALYSR